MLTIGEKLKKLREEKQISLDVLAQYIDVPLVCLRDVELGKRNINEELLKKISEITGVSKDYFNCPVGINNAGSVDNQVDPLSGSVGRKIRKLREEKGYTLIELGRKAGISYTHISEIERGNTCPSLKTVNKLAKVFQLPVTYFFTESSGQSAKEPEIIEKKQQKKAESLIDTLKNGSLEDLEFIEKIIDLVKKHNVGSQTLEDPLIREINYLLRDLSQDEKKALLDYAKFLRSKRIEPASS